MSGADMAMYYSQTIRYREKRGLVYWDVTYMYYVIIVYDRYGL